MRKGFDVRRQPGFTAIAMGCFILLYLPIILLVAYSFNAGESIAIWEGFSWRWYASAWENEQVKDATIRSLILAASSSAVATTAAVLAALATTRSKPSSHCRVQVSTSSGTASAGQEMIG